MIFELAQDFHDAVATMPESHPKHRMLELLEEAIRRDIHFINRHPTTLFQCMWNTCWWYDCPEAEKHYEKPKGVSDARRPWGEPGLKFFSLLQTWRDRKEQATPGFAWLESLRPPPDSIGLGYLRVFRGDRAGIHGVAFSQCGRFIAASASEVRVWEIASGVEVARLATCASGLAFSPDGYLLATLYEAGVRIWDIRTERKLSRFLPLAGELAAVTFSNGGDSVLGITETGEIISWDIETGKTVVRFHLPVDRVSLAQFSSNGKFITVMWRLGEEVWEGQGTEWCCVARQHGMLSITAAYNPALRLLAIALNDCSIELYRACDAAVVTRLKEPQNRVVALAFSPEGDALAAADGDGTVRVWECSSFRQIGCVSEHTDEVTAVAFSSDGRLVASASHDGSIRVRERTAEFVRRLVNHQQAVACVCFQKNGTEVITSTHMPPAEPESRFWSTETGLCLRVVDEDVETRYENSNSPNELICDGTETTVRLRPHGETAAWFPHELYGDVSRCGNLIAGVPYMSWHLYLLRLHIGVEQEDRP